MTTIEKKNTPRPFIKWAGGKSQLIEEIKKRMPKKFNNYYEPFVGGGAIFFSLNLKDKEVYINDYNKELIDSYRAIRSSHKKLIQKMDEHVKEHVKDPENYFYNVRKLDHLTDWKKKNILEKTARFIYLNKTSFNGLYRINKNGHFNVPWNKKTKIKLYDSENLIQIRNLLNKKYSKIKKISLTNKDFELAVKKTAKKNDLLFFDPPYDALKKNTFDSYTQKPFGVNGQKRLAKLIKELNKRGCFVITTNHNTPLVRDLYKEFNIDLIQTKRLINSNCHERKGEEVIIYNYSILNDI